MQKVLHEPAALRGGMKQPAHTVAAGLLLAHPSSRSVHSCRPVVVFKGKRFKLNN